MVFMEAKWLSKKPKSPKPMTTGSTTKIISPTSPMITLSWTIPKTTHSLILTTTQVIMVMVMAMLKSIRMPYGEIALIKQRFIISTTTLGDILISIGASIIPFMTPFGAIAPSLIEDSFDRIGGWVFMILFSTLDTAIMATPILVPHTAMVIEDIMVTDMIVPMHVPLFLEVLAAMVIPTTPGGKDILKISEEPTALVVTVTVE